MTFKPKKEATALFEKIESQQPILSSYMVFQEVCKRYRFKKLELAQNFFHFVDPEDYTITEEDFAVQYAEDKEFRKEYKSAKDYNEKVAAELVEQCGKWEGKGSRIKTISGTLVPASSEELRDLRRRIGKAKLGNKNEINPYFSKGSISKNDEFSQN